MIQGPEKLTKITTERSKETPNRNIYQWNQRCVLILFRYVYVYL